MKHNISLFELFVSCSAWAHAQVFLRVIFHLWSDVLFFSQTFWQQNYTWLGNYCKVSMDSCGHSWMRFEMQPRPLEQLPEADWPSSRPVVFAWCWWLSGCRTSRNALAEMGLDLSLEQKGKMSQVSPLHAPFPRPRKLIPMDRRCICSGFIWKGRR